MGDIYIFKSNGFYLGYIRNGFLFNRDGLYLGWVDGNHIWDSKGQYKGMLFQLNGHHYILNNKFTLPPTPRMPRIAPSAGIPPIPPQNITPLNLPVQLEDAFN